MVKYRQYQRGGESVAEDMDFDLFFSRRVYGNILRVFGRV